MKLLGVIGGMAYPSTMEYYMKINKIINLKKGGWNSAQILLYSIEFQEMIDLQNQNDWNRIREIMCEKALILETAGCNALMICSNTMHKIVPSLEQAISVPILHIVDAVGENILTHNIKKVILLGTKSTMEGDFYSTRLLEKFGIETIIPEEKDRNFINYIIYEELAQDLINPNSKQQILEIITKLQQVGAEGIIMGCGEIPLILKPQDTILPLFNSMELHVHSAVNFLLE